MPLAQPSDCNDIINMIPERTCIPVIQFSFGAIGTWRQLRSEKVHKLTIMNSVRYDYFGGKFAGSDEFSFGYMGT